MAEFRRHSVDIPISKTLVALRRVRSLRDPSTISMSKFSAVLDHVNWENNSNNEISLHFVNGCQEGVCDNYGMLRSKDLGLAKEKEDYVDGFQMKCGFTKSKLISCEDSGWEENAGSPIRTKHIKALDHCADQEEDYRHGSLKEKYLPSREDVDSYNESILRSPIVERIDQTASSRKPRCENRVKSSVSLGDIASCVGSPFTSISCGFSTNSTSAYVNEDVDDEDHSHRGCGISGCWSRTPKFRESNLSSDVEGRPLLCTDVNEMAHYEQRGSRLVGKEMSQYSETCRSLSQKFRPKSFDDLVGQNAVARSLLGAILKGKITSFYLFHGPRGTGKTSAARVFAAALNCLSLEEHGPCGACRECALFFSGRSRDVKEVDSTRINKSDRVRSLIKNAVAPPISSRFKVFIIDECHLLHGGTWSTVLGGLENLSQHVVFVMITPDLDKLPRSAVSWSQRYHFPKIKDADIARRLEKICVEEGVDFDKVALDLISAKSNGSIRDAEMMLEQLSLLGKKITLSLAHDLIGIVSDDELLDLLDLALSSDTSNTVIRARDLMRSRIDPMQLISQLANLIMDILAGKREDSSEVRRRFFSNHTAEADLQKLNHALKILSETEKQLRISKNQSTWLTVALLQLSSMESFSLHVPESKLCLGNVQDKDGDFCSASSTGENLKHLAGSCDDNKPNKLGQSDDCKGTLESIWKRVAELSQSNSLRNFLKNRGKLSTLSINQGLAIAELEFFHPDHVSRAEKSWKLIASSLQSVLGRNVEIRINLAQCASDSKYDKLRKPYFRFFSCSRRMKQKSQLSTECGSDSEFSGYASEKLTIRETPILTCSSDCGPQMPHNCCHRMEAIRNFRNSDGNVLSTRTTSSPRTLYEDAPKAPLFIVNSPREERNNCRCQLISDQEPESQPNCFPKTLRFQKKLRSADMTHMICCIEQQNKVALSIPRKKSFETCISVSEPYVLCSSTNHYTNSSRDENG